MHQGNRQEKRYTAIYSVSVLLISGLSIRTVTSDNSAQTVEKHLVIHPCGAITAISSEAANLQPKVIRRRSLPTVERTLDLSIGAKSPCHNAIQYSSSIFSIYPGQRRGRLPIRQKNVVIALLLV